MDLCPDVRFVDPNFSDGCLKDRGSRESLIALRQILHQPSKVVGIWNIRIRANLKPFLDVGMCLQALGALAMRVFGGVASRLVLIVHGLNKVFDHQTGATD